MSDVSYREIARNGLWTNNPALVQILGLCPLLAVSGSVVNALGLGLATLLVLAGSNLVVSLIRRQVSDAVRIPVFVMIIATFTTCTELLMKAYTSVAPKPLPASNRCPPPCSTGCSWGLDSPWCW